MAREQEPNRDTDDDAGTEAPALSPDRVRVRKDRLGALHVTVDGTERETSRVSLAFPISGKADYVSFLDAEGEEIALLAHPDQLDDESRTAVAAALERMYYVPKIRRVDSIKESWGVSHWEVVTDCGYASFEVVDREHIRRVSGGRFLIQDADGNRFEIEDAAQLDPQSRKLIYSET